MVIDYGSPTVVPRTVVLEDEATILGYDGNNEPIYREETWILKGECNRCGVCCAMPSNSQLWDKYFKLRDDGACGILEDMEIDGIKVTRCAQYIDRPFCCALYPSNPYADKIEKCSYIWEKIK